MPIDGVVNQTSLLPCVVAAVSTTRITAKTPAAPTRIGNARERGPSIECCATTSHEMPIASATYTGLGASWSAVVAATAQTNHVTACHGREANACTVGCLLPRVR